MTGNRADDDRDGEGSGGGIFRSSLSGAVVISPTNTIVAGNTDASPSGSVHPDVSGTFASQGYNLIGDGSGASGFSASGDLVGSSGSPLDARLGQLQTNGGPTLTHALLVGSPALDAGNPAGCDGSDGDPLPIDQRGVPRPQGARCDRGAYEFVPTTTTILRSSANPARFSQTIAFTATVSDGERDSVPGGSVTFLNGSSFLGSAPLIDGVATLSTTTLTIGNHAIRAVYGGDGVFTGSESPVLVQLVRPDRVLYVPVAQRSRSQ